MSSNKWFFIGYWIKTGLDLYPGPFVFIACHKKQPGKR